MNKVILMGRLTADPNLNQTQSGISSCRFSIAVNRNFKNQQGTYDADFINCIAWRQTAEFVSRYFKKGGMICVEGTLRNNNYQDKKHPDVTHYTMEVLVDNVEFCGSKAESGTAGNNNYNNNGNNYSNNSNNSNYQTAPQQTAPPQQSATSNNDMSYGNLGDFEEILNDGDVPF